LPVAAVKSKAYRPFKPAFDDDPVIMTEVLAFFVLSVMEAAMMTTCPPAGGAEGAVYIVLAPLIVETGLNEPQVELGVQLQLTPAPAVSLETVAATLAVPPAASEEGGEVVIVTMIDVGPGSWATTPQPERATVATTRTMAAKRRTGAFLFIKPPLRISRLKGIHAKY